MFYLASMISILHTTIDSPVRLSVNWNIHIDARDSTTTISIDWESGGWGKGH